MPSLLSGFITIVGGVHIILVSEPGSKISFDYLLFSFYFLFLAVSKKKKKCRIPVKIVPVLERKKFLHFNLVSARKIVPVPKKKKKKKNSSFQSFFSHRIQVLDIFMRFGCCSFLPFNLVSLLILVLDL
jgi:hypothetical protein